jgi:hypothetical protein
MSTLSTTLIAIAAVGVLFVVLPVATDVYLRFRGRRKVTCPETHGAVEVSVDAWHAAATALPGPPRMYVTDCTRWPERERCGQTCMADAR